MTSESWDERYQEWDYVWSVEPNRFIREMLESADLVAGDSRRALDLACGEGRNSVWLAENGWRVTGVDYSPVGLKKAERLAADRGVADRVELMEADVTTWQPPQVYDLVVVSYLQLPEQERRRALAAAAGALRPGGTLLLAAHDSANLQHGSGGPRDPEVLYTPEAVIDDLERSSVGWSALHGETRTREVEGDEPPALDTIVSARRLGRVVEVFADVGCPFAHLGLRRIVDARTRAGRPDVVLHVRAWPLEIVNGKPMDAERVAEHVDELRAGFASGEFVGFRRESFPSTTIPAMALGAAAYEAGVEVGEAVSLELRDMLFEQGEDIGDPAVLSALARRHGVDFDPETENATATATATAMVEADHAEGVARGVVGSPHFFTGGGDFFCPALNISRDEAGALHVEMDEAGFESFLEACFAPDDDAF
jgi:predicted DsbA family dithiol-disulfide isomerase